MSTQNFTTKNLANIITWSRFILTVLIGLFYAVSIPYLYEVIFILFSIASISDFFDGYFARKFGTFSKFGRCFDQIFDKLLVILMIVLLVDSQILPFWMAIFVISREIYVSGIREYMGDIGKVLPVSKIGKWKTGFQIVATGSTVFASCKHFYSFVASCKFCSMITPFVLLLEYLPTVSYVLFLISIFLSFYSAFLYSKAAFC